MTYRQLRAKETPEQISDATVESELAPEQVAALIRQSTAKQTRENLESADLQLSGAQKYAISQGLDADKIMIAFEGDGKRGVSGTLRIDQREKLQEVMAGIYADKIKRVWAYSVSRLFRDKYGVQVGTFIEACAKHHVKVVIETAQTFDFSDSMHILIFQSLANVAARENEDRSKLLHAANKNKALRGEYDGRPLTPGFIVDRDKLSPTYNKYIPYEPHKQVVNRLLARYREHGQFNRLASEVEKMAIVFPSFEDWVDKLDRSKFQFVEVCSVHGPDRKTKIKDRDGKWRFKPIGCQFKGADCKLLGYHISSNALFNLLTSVELMGYWAVDGAVLTDEPGQSLVNHEAIVDDPADWEYSFYRLSHTLLDGTPNPNRIAPHATWTAATVKQVDREPQTLLEGILTSPLGTVHLYNDTYSVSERRSPNTHQRSKTLTIDARWVEDEFRRRLLDRIDITNYEQMLYDALRNVQANNVRALVSVDQQIAGYQAEIRNIEAFILANGAKTDQKTLQEFNQTLVTDRANLANLETKKNEANAEEQDLRDLCTTLWDFRNHGKKNNEQLRRFIKLATDVVSIDEYSSHFIRLTVVWCTPFAQVDVCYFYRENGGKLGWSEEDERDLARLYPAADRLELLQRFYTKTWICIMDHAKSKGIERNTRLNSSGIIGPSLSLADWDLLQKYGWKREKGAHWLIDVPTSECGDLPTLS